MLGENIIKYDGNNFTNTTTFGLDSIHVGVNFRTFFIDKIDNIWLGANIYQNSLTSYALCQYDNFSWKWHFITNSNQNINWVNDIAQDAKGKMWIACFDSILSYDGSNYSGFKIPNVKYSGHGAYRILIDNADSKWLLNGNGVVYKYTGQ